MPVREMNLLEPNIKGRFASREELAEFLNHYDMKFPCHIHIWHGAHESVWRVVPETESSDNPARGLAEVSKDNRTTGATTPAYQPAREANRTGPAQ